MTEHLPECWATHESDPPAWCICDELRACEHRVLDAARNAIAALIPFEFWEAWCVVKNDALLAIAAINGDQP